MKRSILSALILCLLSTPLAARDFLPGAGQIDEAEILERMRTEVQEPATPETAPRENQTEDNEDNSRRRTRFQVILERKGQAPVAGVIRLTQNRLHFRTSEGHSRIAPSEIQFLEIASWLARPTASDVFYLPHRCTLRLNSGETLQGELDAPEWLQLAVHDKGTLFVLRTYFRQAGRQSPSEISAEAVPDGTVVRVEFTPEVQDGPDA